ncbi:hypothetical protein V7O62_08340 [Methanolobus sp. ZRKC2]|uniref:hypothetical protein n=1 Tax=Methanolobus sp. ZRKC2 TaxID=3125783 RepID=UPI0032565DE3
MNETGNTGEEDTEVDEESTGEDSPAIDPANFVEEVDNPYFPLEPGTTFVYEGESELKEVDAQMYVTNQTKEVMGVNATVVRDTEWIDGEIVEESYNWYAQDTDGNVWYLGKDAKDYDNGEVIDTVGSWEAGVDGAEPGIIMLGDPQPGLAYREVYYEDRIEDQAAVVSLGENVTVPYGSFENSLLIQEWSDLELGYEVNKYYVEDVGLVKEMTVRGAIEDLELVDITTE